MEGFFASRTARAINWHSYSRIFPSAQLRSSLCRARSGMPLKRLHFLARGGIESNEDQSIKEDRADISQQKHHLRCNTQSSLTSPQSTVLSLPPKVLARHKGRPDSPDIVVLSNPHAAPEHLFHSLLGCCPQTQTKLPSEGKPRDVSLLGN